VQYAIDGHLDDQGTALIRAGTRRPARGREELEQPKRRLAARAASWAGGAQLRGSGRRSCEGPIVVNRLLARADDERVLPRAERHNRPGTPRSDRAAVE
jgi:hypothetical protein